MYQSQKRLSLVLTNSWNCCTGCGFPKKKLKCEKSVGESQSQTCHDDILQQIEEIRYREQENSWHIMIIELTLFYHGGRVFMRPLLVMFYKKFSHTSHQINTFRLLMTNVAWKLIGLLAFLLKLQSWLYRLYSAKYPKTQKCHDPFVRLNYFSENFARECNIICLIEWR